MASVLVAACDPPSTALRRLEPRATSGVSRPATVASVTRDAVTIVASDGGRAATFDGADLGPGTIRVAVALRRNGGRPQGAARVKLHGTDLRAAIFGFEVPDCELRWTGATETEGWLDCDLEVPRRLGGATVEVALEGEVDADLVVATPVHVPRALEKRPDVFVFLIDTVRNDKIRPFSQRLPIGDRFTDLSRDAITLANLRSSSSWTRTAVATLFTGLRADRHEVYGRLDLLGPTHDVLPEILRPHGYETLAWSTNANVLPLWGFGRGFDSFHDVGAEKWAGDKTDGEALLDVVRADLERSLGAPGFYYIHLMDAHEPYLPPAADRRAVDAIPKVAETFPRPLAVFSHAKVWDHYRSYLGELIDLDRAVGRFIEWMKDRGRYDNAVILVVSDHGEEFIDHGTTGHGKTLFEEVLRVPALLKLPNQRSAGVVVEEATRFEDLLPTLLVASGIAPSSSIDGCDLFGASVEAPGEQSGCRGRPQIAELRLDGRTLASVTLNSWKLIVDLAGDRRQLYDLAADPLELTNKAAAEPSKLAEMESLLAGVLSRADYGWHVRVCGGDAPSEVTLRVVSDVDVSVSGDSLEVEDAVDAAGGAETATTARFELRPYQSVREHFGQFFPRTVRDEDELRIEAPPPGSTLKLSIEPVARILLGNATEPQHEASLDLAALRDEATVSGATAIACPPPPPPNAERPPSEPAESAISTVRVWYVAPPAALSAEQVDPALTERLRALGYVW